MITGMNHVAIVVRNLDDALKLYQTIFGLKPSKIETVLEQGVKTALLPLPHGGESELLEPIDANSGVGKFLESKGEGMHHICLDVDDVDAELASLTAKGIQLIDKKGRKGLAGKVGFIHPKSVKGVLVELAQKTGGH